MLLQSLCAALMNKTEAVPPCAQPRIEPDSLPKYLIRARTGKVGKWVGKVSSMGWENPGASRGGAAAPEVWELQLHAGKL